MKDEIERLAQRVEHWKLMAECDEQKHRFGAGHGVVGVRDTGREAVAFAAGRQAAYQDVLTLVDVLRRRMNRVESGGVR